MTKKKILTLLTGLAAVLLVVFAVLMTPSRTTEPMEPVDASQTTELCFVNWEKAGMLSITVSYDDGKTVCDTLSVDRAREKYADDGVVLAKIEATVATERNVVWWMNDTDVFVGVGNDDDILPVEEAVTKYADNTFISEKLQRLQRIRAEDAAKEDRDPGPIVASSTSDWHDTVTSQIRDNPAFGVTALQMLTR